MVQQSKYAPNMKTRKGFLMTSSCYTVLTFTFSGILVASSYVASPFMFTSPQFFSPKVDSRLGVNRTGWAKLGCTVVSTQIDKTCEFFPSPQGLI